MKRNRKRERVRKGRGRGAKVQEKRGRRSRRVKEETGNGWMEGGKVEGKESWKKSGTTYELSNTSDQITKMNIKNCRTTEYDKTAA